MNRQELDVLTKQAEEMVEQSAKSFTEALTAYIRLQVQRDMLFLQTGDKTLVEERVPR